MAFSTLFLDASSGSGTMDGIKDMVSDLSQTIGVDLFEEDIDNVVFQTNEFLCNSDFIGSQGPFWWILQMSMALGAYYSKPYYKIDGVRAADEYGITAGFGLPIPRTRSVLSLSAQYVRTKGTQAAFLNENTLRICIGVTFNERWFFKRKVD